MFARWTSGWRGDAEEIEIGAARCRKLAPIICLVYAMGWTFIAFDQVMSLTPTWYSNLFGAYFCWGGFLCGVAATALLMVLHRNSPGLEGEITKARMHDIGKMLFAFSIFWMYLFFSQYLVIWYANLPGRDAVLRGAPRQPVPGGQVGHQHARTGEDLGTRPLLGAPARTVREGDALRLGLLLGGSLLGAARPAPEEDAGDSRPGRAVVLFGFWLERNVLVWPSLVPKDSFSFLGVVQLGIAAGFLGAFVLVFLLYTRIFPSLAVPRRA